MIPKRIAIVTGANKGIGYETVRKLLKEEFDGDVFLTARNECRGRTAILSLEQEGLKPRFLFLDLNDANSIEKARDHILKEYGGLDVLINNASMAFKHVDATPFAVQAKETIRTNFTAWLTLCDVLFPILKPGARVVNVSSFLACKTFLKCSPQIQDKFRAAANTKTVMDLMDEFVEACEKGTHTDQGWPEQAYGLAKLAMNTVTAFQQKELDEDLTRTGILVNACCTGWCRTDMNGHTGPLTAEEGSITPVYLATLPQDSHQPKGQYLMYKVVQDRFNHFNESMMNKERTEELLSQVYV